LTLTTFNDQIHRITRGGGHISIGKPRPTVRGGAPALPNFWGSLSIYACTACRRTAKFDVVTHMGRGIV